MAELAKPGDVRSYWLETLEPKDWYVARDVVDATIRERFLDTWTVAHNGGCQDWLTNAADLLAYIILCDQFPRNMFRGDGRSFATDSFAVAATQKAIEAGWDLETPEPARQFIYVTLMHAEDLDLQKQAIDHFANRMPETGEHNRDHALAHAWVIKTFGRFPYRNDALGRRTTAAEQAFLDAGGYGYALQKVRDETGD